MIVSTVLNLVVVPAMYLIIDEVGTRLRTFGQRLSGPPNMGTTGSPAHAPALNGAVLDREHSVRERT
jgi:hypothetical protein